MVVHYVKVDETLYISIHMDVHMLVHAYKDSHFVHEIIMLCIYIIMCVFIYRVKQIVGFDAEDMVGQELLNFFHPSEMSNGIEHTKCRKQCKVPKFS